MRIKKAARQKARKIQLKQKSGEGMSDLESKEVVICGGKLVWIELCMSASGQWTPVILSALVGSEDIMLHLRDL